jgi:hypothetical protein
MCEDLIGKAEMARLVVIAEGLVAMGNSEQGCITIALVMNEDGKLAMKSSLPTEDLYNVLREVIASVDNKRQSKLN